MYIPSGDGFYLSQSFPVTPGKHFVHLTSFSLSIKHDLVKGKFYLNFNRALTFGFTHDWKRV